MNVLNFPLLHCGSVASLAYRLARRIGLSNRESEFIRMGAFLHDLGKIYIPSSVLNKPDQLNKHERNLISHHPLNGVKILNKLEKFKKFRPMVLFHHERWDGEGYPYGLKGDEIPISSQIISVADAFNSMTSNRPYRKALSKATALQILMQGAGEQWRSNLVLEFCDLIQTKPSNSFLYQNIREWENVFFHTMVPMLSQNRNYLEYRLHGLKVA